MFINVTNKVFKLSALLSLWALSSCSINPNNETEKPVGLPASLYQFPDNIDVHKAASLGKLLFFDKRLSADGKVACADCHRPSSAFADVGNKVSRGVYGRVGTRNTPSLLNLIWQESFMWDGGINHIEWVSLAALTDTVEMGMDIGYLLEWLSNDSFYKTEFQQLFKTQEITTRKLMLSFTAFLVGQTSENTNYDKFKKGLYVMHAEEAKGHSIFIEKCNTCHTAPLFTSSKFVSNGVKPKPGEEGRMRITQNPLDFGKFKIPSLRNVMKSYPYMHDGRFESIEQVLMHYVETNPKELGEDEKYYPNPLTKDEIPFLIAFLKTIND